MAVQTSCPSNTVEHYFNYVCLCVGVLLYVLLIMQVRGLPHRCVIHYICSFQCL